MKKIFVFISLAIFSVSTIPFSTEAKTPDKSEPKAILVTPPAPKFSDAERQAELARRRQAVAEKMADNSMLIMMSAEPKLYTNDVDYVYRQENNLYYLTNLKQNGATFVLIKNGGKVQEILFMPKRNPAFETWNGKMYSNEQATTISGLDKIVDSRETPNFLAAIKDKKSFTAKDNSLSSEFIPQTIYIQNGDKREYRREIEFASGLSGYKIENAEPIFAELRLIKSPYEIKLMQHAIDITTEAQMRSMAMVGRAKWEYEVQAEVEYTFRRRNADFWGYPSIVGCGPNATTLHYVESQGEVKAGDLLLMDVGAEYDHYTADVTRTFPVNGKFTKAQAEIYQIVFDAQEAAAAQLKPGARISDASRAAAEVIKNGLAKLGLITAPDAKYQAVFNGQTVELNQYQLWYMHGWGHWLGMNVHDVGNYSVTLQEGMIMTNEPGIYIREEALDFLTDTPANKEFIAKVRPVFEKYKNIGVRIEDDMLITKTGTDWMSKKLPRTLKDIEAFMARASKEFNYSRVPKQVDMQLAGLGNDLDWNPLVSNSFPQGRTMREGFVWAGKNAAYSGLSHTKHSDGEYPF